MLGLELGYSSYNTLQYHKHLYNNNLKKHLYSEQKFYFSKNLHLPQLVENRTLEDVNAHRCV